MNKLLARVSTVNWRVAFAVASLVLFAVAGSAGDPDPM